jgi:gliding motility-associated-like protein
MRKNLSLLFLLTAGHLLMAQTPVVQNIDPVSTYPNDTITISGSGFSATESDLEVWFGAVKGGIVSSSEFSILATVPAQASMANITVFNKVSKLSAQSSLKFIPTFKGNAFDISKFSAPVTFTSQQELWDLHVKDLNGDGKPDVIASKFQSISPFQNATDIMILKNQSTLGNLSFTKIDQTNLPALNTTFASDGIITADLEGDGKPEIIFCRAGSTRNSIHILKNTSTLADITFNPQFALPLDAQNVATRLSARDLNRDGKPEIVVSNTFNENIYIFINQSDGATISFNTTPLKLSVKVFASDPTTNNYEVEVQDFNGDNLADLVVNEFQQDSLHIFKNISAGSVAFAPRVTIPTTGLHNRLTSADVNHDGKLDLIVTSTLNSKLLVFLNESTLSTISFNLTPIELTTRPEVWGVDTGDIDGDDDIDIVTANRNDTGLSIFTNNGNLTSPAFTKIDLASDFRTRNVRISDMDGDGKPDVLYTSFNPNVVPNIASLEIRRNLNCHQPDIMNDDLEDVVVCNGQTIHLKTFPANNVTYQWTKNGVNVGGDEPFLEISSAGGGEASGTYVVTTTGEGGACQINSAAVVVTEDTGSAPANPALNAATPLCSGSQINLTTDALVGTEIEYIWTGPNNFTSDVQNPVIANATPANTGPYTLQVKVDGCTSYETTKLIEVADLGNFVVTTNSATNTVCDGQTVILNTTSLANHTYQWKKDGADIITNGQSATYNATEDGVYTVIVTNLTLNCDTETDPVTVTVMTLPTADYTAATTVCSTQEIQFTDASQVDSRATLVYAWNFGDATNSTEPSPVKTYATGQSVNPVLTVSYAGVTGCTDNVSKPLTVFASVSPVITPSATALCPEEEATLSITGTFNAIVWTPTGNTNTIDIVGPGTFTVTTNDTNNCPGADDVVIDAKEAPIATISANPSLIVSGAQSQLTVNATNPNASSNTYVWTPGETLSDATISSPVASPVTTTPYNVVITSVDGCTEELDVTVTVEGILTFPLSFSPNGDGLNEEWNIRAQDKPECTLTIFDGRGRRVFEAKGQNWDGMYSGAVVPTGTYFYVFGCPDETPATGHVLVVR